VIDSMEDPLLEAPAGSVSIPGCNCGPWTGDPPATCGLTDATSGKTCTEQQYLRTRVCTGAACSKLQTGPLVLAKCVAHSLCCSTWKDNCAAVKDLCCGAIAGCPDDELYEERICGVTDDTTVVTENQCRNDPVCKFLCQGTEPGGSKYQSCSGSKSGLVNNTTNWTIVANCTPGVKCEVQCNTPAGTVPQPLGCDNVGTMCITCDCIAPQTWDLGNQICLCGFGYAVECPGPPPDPTKCLRTAICNNPGACGGVDCPAAACLQ